MHENYMQEPYSFVGIEFTRLSSNPAGTRMSRQDVMSAAQNDFGEMGFCESEHIIPKVRCEKLLTFKRYFWSKKQTNGQKDSKVHNFSI